MDLVTEISSVKRLIAIHSIQKSVCLPNICMYIVSVCVSVCVCVCVYIYILEVGIDYFF